MEVESGSMILHPDLANELRALHESSSFDTVGAFLKHLFTVEEQQQRSQQSLFTDLELLGNLNTSQASSLNSTWSPKTASVGVQVKLCSCSDKVVVLKTRARSAVRIFDSIQRGDLQDETSDSTDQSDSDYSVTEDIAYKSRKRKQNTKTVNGKPKKKTVAKQQEKQKKDDLETNTVGKLKSKLTKDNGETETVSMPKTKRKKDDLEAKTGSKPQKERRKPGERGESITKSKRNGKKSEGAKANGKLVVEERDSNSEEEEDTFFPCKDCEATFTSVAEYDEHMQKHTDEILKSYKYGHLMHVVQIKERPYVCKKCGKTYTTISGLQHHNRTRNGAHPFKCKQCHKEYTTPHALKMHIVRFHERPGVNEYECLHCDKKFAKKWTLLMHTKNKHPGAEDTGNPS